MRRPVLLYPDESPESGMDTEYNLFRYIFQEAPLDYRCYRLLYTTTEGGRALATITRDAKGGLEVRRILPGHMDSSSDLRNWLETAIFLDMFAPCQDNWMRDQEEEARLRARDRSEVVRRGRHD